ncbi:hypothetical protein M0R72_11870 [Candidatus Pacearchaeota archaeon]|jgi:hypothetical protein|nr:hypothetical protein [Candidatus Pacearchaeota archaeon]
MSKSLEVYKEALEKIESSDVLNPEEMLRLEGLTEELKHTVATQTIYRTPTEALTSVLNHVKHPTPASKYHQAKLEQLVMFQNLMSLSFDYREAQIDLVENESLQKDATGFALERLKVNHDRLMYRLSCMRNEAKERLREIEMWSDIKTQLGAAAPFDHDDKDTDQLQSLTLRYLQELPAAVRAGNDVGGAINIIAQSATMLSECERRKIPLPLKLVERSKRLLKGA